MGILQLFKKNSNSDNSKPLLISVSMIPYVLKANERSSSTVNVKIKNLLNEPALISLRLEVPKPLSVDYTGLIKEKEVKLGLLNPKEEKEANIDIFSNTGTDEGEYTIKLVVFKHYKDYTFVENQLSTSFIARVVSH